VSRNLSNRGLKSLEEIYRLNSKGKIIFIVNGLGLGNSTRCDSFIPHLLSLGYSVDVITSGNGVHYFHSLNNIHQVFEFKSLYYGKDRRGNLSIKRTFLSLPKLLHLYKENVKYLRSILKKGNYRGIIIDSDYTIMWLKRGIKIPIIGLNNSDIIVSEVKKFKKVPRSIRLQYCVEKMDYLFHKWVPDLVLSPAILPHYSNNGKFKHFAPFIRPGLNRKKNSGRAERILVMLSGSQFGTPVEFLENFPNIKNLVVDVIGREGPSTEGIRYHGRVFRNKELINKADMMVVNGGFSAVSEAVVLQKPAVVIPIDNHAEQFVNATLFENAGLGLFSTPENAVGKILEVMDNFNQYKKNHEKMAIEMQGSVDASRIIDEFIQPDLNENPAS